MSVQPCNTAPLVEHGVVAFEPAAFRLLYPSFTDPPYTDVMLQGYFALATMIISNRCGSVICDAVERERLLNLLVAHIATIFTVSPAGSALVGRVNKATEGTVSIGAEYASQVSESMAWFIQTPYGALVWQATADARSFRYIAPAQGCCGPAGRFPGRGGY